MAKASETEVLIATIKACHWHPGIAWAERRHTGGYVVRGRLVEAKEAIGNSDVLGQMKTGEALEIEVKKPGEWPDKEKLDAWEALPHSKRTAYQHRLVMQRKKLRRCWENNGYAGVIESVDEVQLVAGPCRVPLRLHLPEPDGVPF